MTTIAYQGPSNIRILDASDLKRAGVEDFKKTEFPRRVAVEVSEQVALAILERPRLYGIFKEQALAPAEVRVQIVEAERRVELTPPVESSNEAPADSGSAAEDTGSSARKTPKKTT